MSVIYVVLPLTEDVAELLKERHIEFSEVPGDPQALTPSNITRALRSLNEFEVTSGVEGGVWQVALEHKEDDERSTLLVGHGYKNETSPIQLAFEGGDPRTVLETVVLLSKQTGTLVVFPDTEETPAIVSGRTKVQELLSTWEHTAD